MKHFFHLIIPTFLAIAILVFSECKKEQQPSIVGQWETVESLGYKWDFDIDDDGQFCRSLAEAFGTTQFCFPYLITGSELILNAPVVERWSILFVCDDVADITITYPDDSVQRMILKRKQ